MARKKRPGILINLLSFTAPIPIIAVFASKDFLTDLTGPIVFTVLAGLAIACGAGLFLIPFIISFKPMFSGGGYYAFWGRGKAAAHTLLTGRSAIATIVSIGENSGGGTMTINDQPVLNLVMSIDDDYNPPYETSMDTLIPRSRIPQFQPGAMFRVKVNSEDKLLVVLDTSQATGRNTQDSGENIPQVGEGDWTETDRKAVEERGIDGTAKILEITDTGRTDNFKPVAHVLYEVSVPGSTPYTSGKDYALDSEVIEALQAQTGKVFKARVHPDNPERFMVEINFS